MKRTAGDNVAMDTKKLRGRPCTFDPAIAMQICQRLANGESLRKICQDAHMPNESTVRGWVIDDHNGFAAHYTRARHLLAERWAEEVLEVADTPAPTTESGSTDGGFVQDKRLRVDARKWLLSKVLPKVYGDKVSVDHSGSVGLNINIDLGAPPPEQQR